MAKVALDWSGQKNTQDSEEVYEKFGLERFEFTFLVQLKDVNSKIPLEEVLIEQHKVEAEPSEIKFILQNTKTLLIFDGYDEYRKGTNPDVDAAISGERGGKCYCYHHLQTRRLYG